MNYLIIKEGLTGRTKEEQIQKRDSREFFNHVMRYGTILTDDSREDETGCYRDMNIYINKMIARIEMKNGEVKLWGISSYNYFKIENLNDLMSRRGIEYRIIRK